MLNYTIRRLISTLPVMGIVALFVFGLLYLAPGDPAELLAGDNATPDQVAAIRQSFGLDRPLFYRFVTWLGAAAQGDLGTSVYSGKPVFDLIAQRLGPTMWLMSLTMLMTVCIALPMGVFAAARAGAATDRVVSLLSVLGFSVPVFVTAYVLAYVFSIHLRWLPLQGYVPPGQGILRWLSHLILPALALSSVYIALIARITRTTMLEVLNQDYIRTAKAKGEGEFNILFVHALRNAAPAIVTVIGLGVAGMIGGAVITESIFNIPGVGRLTVDAILQRDYPIIQGVVLFFSFVYVVVNLIVDLLYRFFDPRIQL